MKVKKYYSWTVNEANTIAEGYQLRPEEARAYILLSHGGSIYISLIV